MTDVMEWKALNCLQAQLCSLGGRAPLSQLPARVSWSKEFASLGTFCRFLSKCPISSKSNLALSVVEMWFCHLVLSRLEPKWPPM